MDNSIQAVRGMNDLLPDVIELWQHVEAAARDILHAYGYREIRVPLVEKTELFARSIGHVTDIVEKEMYSFEDRSGDSLTLRPEGTAGCVRAGIENGLLHIIESCLPNALFCAYAIPGATPTAFLGFGRVLMKSINTPENYTPSKQDFNDI